MRPLQLLLAFGLLLAAASALPQERQQQQHNPQQRRRVVVRKQRVPVAPFQKIVDEEEEDNTPFAYSFSASRSPGSKPDRFVESQGDENGVVRGSYAYLDPNYNWQTVNYLADPETGFHILPGSSPHSAAHPIDTEPPLPLPEDVPNVAAAKEAHLKLFAEIAADHAVDANRETAAVNAVRAAHADAYERIAAEHASIARQHAKLAEQAEAEAARQRALEEQAQAQQPHPQQFRQEQFRQEQQPHPQQFRQEQEQQPQQQQQQFRQHQQRRQQ